RPIRQRDCNWRRREPSERPGPVLPARGRRADQRRDWQAPGATGRDNSLSARGSATPARPRRSVARSGESRTEKDQLLCQWAAAHCLTDREASVSRDNVLAAGGPGETALDVDWFWKLMRPIPSLLEQPGDLGPSNE